MISMKRSFAAALLVVTIQGCAAVKEGGESMPEARMPEFVSGETGKVRENWEILVPGGSRREYIVSNRIATHFSCEAADPDSRSYHGLYCAMHEYVDSWDLTTGKGAADRGAITVAAAYPHILYRWYGEPGITERILLPDGENALAVGFAGLGRERCALAPWIDMRFIWDTPKPEYRIYWEEKNNLLLLARADDPFEEGRPRWIAVTSDVKLDFEPDEHFRTAMYSKDSARRAMGTAYPFSPGRLSFDPDPDSAGRALFVFGLGVTEDEAALTAMRVLRDHEKLKNRKLARIDSIVDGGAGRPGVPPGPPERRKAFRWARASMDNLIMQQRGRGIYAGFFWFPNYWGRDTFISLPGACLSTKEFPLAREILESFMSYQQDDESSPRLGRFPNIVNPADLQYAGVDGTWWLVRAAWKYYEATGDREFLVKEFPRIRLAIEGALEKAVDGLGFLTHGDGETWMDAGGERNPYSPRGDRAVEVQALFHHGLLAGASWAREIVGTSGGSPDLRRLAGEWISRAELLASSFRDLFWYAGEGYLYDHLNRNGEPDKQIRPNALLALWVYLDTIELPVFIDSTDGEGENTLTLVSSDRFRKIVGRAVNTVILPQGVTSLDPSDPQFHPFHLDFDRYFFDEAYHNGDVWEWLSGPAISCLVAVGEGERAWRLFDPLVREILEEGCVGSLREIRDGRYVEGKEEFGGATSQAWSLAEFIRVSLDVLGLDETKDKR